MGHLSWSEVRDRAIRFSREWSDAKSERAEKQTFWNEFFNVFGITRRSVAAFEAPVRKLTGSLGAIDLFWSGRLLVEHKSRGEDLTAAESQAFRYIEALTAEGRADEVPRYILLSDFHQLALFDLEATDTANDNASATPTTPLRFPLSDLHRHVRSFAFMLGQESVRVDPEDPANFRAFDKMCALHDELEGGGFTGHELERLLVRILFCLFAEDTGLFSPGAFTNFLTDQTREDGSDMGARLNEFFYVLDTPPPKRGPKLDAELAALPYVNGQLFKERLGYPAFTFTMREALLECARFYWARISPAVFGSLFQGILEGGERRQHGAHYTSERDILRVLNPLVIDDLRTELDTIRSDRSNRQASRLEAFHQRLRSLRFLDPACGCGSFLVVAYREIRAIELDVLLALTADGRQQVTDLRHLLLVDVDQFYGVERDEWPARITEVALWLMDHQMNLRASERLGQYFERLPLVTSPRITIANALNIKWSDILSPSEVSFVIGNPPFVGKQLRSPAQREDMDRVWKDVKGCGVLDYVTCWYRRTAEYIKHTSARAAFVSTASISQGEQVAILWTELFKSGMSIQFAHRTFPWVSEARGKAHTHVVVVGFGCTDLKDKKLYDYEVSGPSAGEHGTLSIVRNISPYLIEGNNLFVDGRKQPISTVVRPMSFGNMPNDGGNLLLTDAERDQLLHVAPTARQYVRPFVGPDELMNGTSRHCLWLNGVEPAKVRRIAAVMKRVEAVRKHRADSSRPATNNLAATPMLFGEIRQPTKRYLGVPKTGSERRRYLPVAFFEADVIASTDLFTIEGADYYEFGVLSSLFHVAWVKTVGGRWKSDPRYSATLVYNTFPWPSASKSQRSRIQECARAVEEARRVFLAPSGQSTMSDLYDPLTMPQALASAHSKLDRAVDAAYGNDSFQTDRQRIELLFSMYEQSIATAKKPSIAGGQRREDAAPEAEVSPRKSSRRAGAR